MKAWPCRSDMSPRLFGVIDRTMIRVTSGRGLPAFVGVSEVEDYLNRVVQFFGADQKPASAPVLPSALSLPEALGYLDAVWRAQTRSSLLGIVRPAPACQTGRALQFADEFDARLDAVADVLGQLQVTLTGEEEERAGDAKSLGRLRCRLQTILAPGPFRRAEEALSDLRARGAHSSGWATCRR